MKVAGGDGALEHLFFLDDSYGWAASKNAAYKTTDGGQSWEQVRVNLPAHAEITDINFVNTSLGWLAVERRAPDSNYRENHFWIFQTRDGGQTWRVNYEDGSALAHRVSFIDEKNGWLLGVRYVGISPLRFNLLVLHTSDRGEHWTEVSDGLNRLAAEGQDSVNDWIAGVIPTDQSAATVLTLRGKIFRTTDGGRLWRWGANIEDEPRQSGFGALGIKSDGRLSVAGGAYSDEGVGSVVLSQEDHNSWTRYSLGGVYFANVLFLQQNELLACGSLPLDTTGRDLSRRGGVVLYSSDGGHTWSIIYRTEQVESINKLAAPDHKSVMAIGDGGLIVRLRPSLNLL